MVIGRSKSYRLAARPYQYIILQAMSYLTSWCSHIASQPPASQWRSWPSSSFTTASISNFNRLLLVRDMPSGTSSGEPCHPTFCRSGRRRHVGTARASAAQDDKTQEPICCRDQVDTTRWIPSAPVSRQRERDLKQRGRSSKRLSDKLLLMQDARYDWLNRRASYPSS